MLLMAQDVIGRSNGGSCNGGFNTRIHGETSSYDYTRHGDYEGLAGWELADGMIRSGKVFYVHNFHRSHGGCPGGGAFLYGGKWVCNTCNNEGLDEPWWVIKVQKDGDAWCCIGSGFEDLQASDNYAFGDTREEAIKNYGDLCVNAPVKSSEIPQMQGTAAALEKLTIKTAEGKEQ